MPVMVIVKATKDSEAGILGSGAGPFAREDGGSRVTSDGGLILVRELDERLGFGELIFKGFPARAVRIDENACHCS